MSQLVQMLLQAGVVTPEQAQEARAQQVVYGDRIGTNLVDLGYVNETLLAQALGALHQVSYAAGPAAETTPTIARALPGALAARISAVPAKWDGKVMYVFMIDPRNARQIDELEKSLKRRVQPVVVCEARMWELLSKYYKVRKGMRALSLDGDPMARARELMKAAARGPAAAPPPAAAPMAARPTAQPTMPAVSARPVAAAAPPPAAPMLGEELSDENEFYAIYQGSAGGTGPSILERAMGEGTPPAAPQPPPEPAVMQGTLLPPEPVQGVVLAPPVAGIPVVESSVAPPPAAPIAAMPLVTAHPAATPPPPPPLPVASVVAPPPAPPQAAAPPPPPPPPVVEAPAEQGPDWGAEAVAPPPPPPPPPPVVEAPAPAQWGVAAFDSSAPEAELDIAIEEAPPLVEEPVLPKRPESPMSFDEAKKTLAGVEDRNEIGRSVLRYAISRFKRSMLLTVQKDLALGWDALGEGLDQEVAERVILPLQQPSIFRLATESRAHFLGPVPKQPVNFLFLKLIGGKVPRSAFVIPIVVRGKVVNLLYCDNGGGQEAATDIGELLILAQHINRSYEALLKKAA